MKKKNKRTCGKAFDTHFDAKYEVRAKGSTPGAAWTMEAYVSSKKFCKLRGWTTWKGRNSKRANVWILLFEIHNSKDWEDNENNVR